MLFLNTLVITLFWVITPVLCLPEPTNQAHNSLNVQSTSNLTWEGILTEGGPNVTFTGRSIAEISAHIRAVAPDFVFPERTAPSRRPGGARPSFSFVVERSEHRLLCDKVVADYANYYDALDLIAELQAMPGFCRVAPTLKDQPLSCNRLTCSGSSAVYLCNHSDNHDSISTCARVGQYAEDIIEWCYDGKDANVKGQIYDGDYWSVMVHADKC